jgi:VWFA-related protein
MIRILFAPLQNSRPGGRGRRSSFYPVALAFLLFAGILTNGVNSAGAADDRPVTITPMSRAAVSTEHKPGSLRVDVNVVLIPVLVSDIYDRPVRGLSKESFRLFEGAAEQKITQFFSQDAPVSIGLVFDASHSMLPKLAQTQQAVGEFLNMTMPGDEFFLLKFSDRPEPVQGFTTDTAEIDAGVRSIQAKGWTSLFDAIYLGLNTMKHAALPRKVLLILSDGGDNNSRYSEKEIRRLVEEADVRIFSISILGGSTALEKLSEESGGKAFRVKNVDELPDLASKLSAEIHDEYVLGYTPSNDQTDGLYRKVKVDLLQPSEGPRLRTSWKRGYYSPTQ